MSLEQAWYKQSAWLKLLRPVEFLFRKLAARRRQQYGSGIRSSWTAPVPVIVVGNISVGGTGKSPLVIWLIEHLREQGYKPGVISRGYGAEPESYPHTVTAADSAAAAGDEPLMIVRRTGIPLVTDPDRVAAAKQLLKQYDCDLIISDDGLQHYALNRSIELVVVDGKRGFGNGRCLPEGPLREPVSRLDEVDLIVVNGESTESVLPDHLHDLSFSMSLKPGDLVGLSGQQAITIDKWPFSRKVRAVAGIGNPQRFANTLSALHFEPELHSFPDHYRFKESDFQFSGDRPVIMTEKDAVKCDHIELSDAWYLQVDAEPEQGFAERLDQLLRDQSAKT